MSAIPGVRFDITGASGSQGALSPRSSWRCYVFPRGAHASQDSTGTVITFDSAGVAGRFAADDWIQVGLSTDNQRKVNAVGGNSLSVQGSAVTVSENDRVFLIGSTQPTVTGGSATYTIPRSFIYQRGDDTADRYTNSMVTSDSNGLIQFYSDPAVYDCIIQDGNGSNQGHLADIPVGVAEGISTSHASVFGSTVTINAAFGVTGFMTATTVTVNMALGVTGWATFGATVTMNAALGVTGTATIGSTATFNSQIGVTGHATFGATVTVNGALGVTGAITGTSATLSNMLTGTSATFTSDVDTRRIFANNGTALEAADFSLNGEWGSTAAVSVFANSFDQRGGATVAAWGATFGTSPQVTLTFKDGPWPLIPRGVVCRANSTLPQSGFFYMASASTSSVTFGWTGGDLVNNTLYSFQWILMG